MVCWRLSTVHEWPIFCIQHAKNNLYACLCASTSSNTCCNRYLMLTITNCINQQYKSFIFQVIWQKTFSKICLNHLFCELDILRFSHSVFWMITKGFLTEGEKVYTLVKIWLQSWHDDSFIIFMQPSVRLSVFLLQGLWYLLWWRIIFSHNLTLLFKHQQCSSSTAQLQNKQDETTQEINAPMKHVHTFQDFMLEAAQWVLMCVCVFWVDQDIFFFFFFFFYNLISQYEMKTARSQFY